MLLSLQLSAEELVVPLDSAGKIFFIDNKTARELNLFTEFENLVEVQLYKTDDNQYFLEVIYLSENRRVKSRKQLTETEVEELRSKVTQAIYSSNHSLYLNQEGRTDFLINTALLSLFVWGPSVPILFDISNGATATGLSLLTSGLCFIIPYYITQLYHSKLRSN